jgi:hypothetical protein
MRTDVRFVGDIFDAIPMKPKLCHPIFAGRIVSASFIRYESTMCDKNSAEEDVTHRRRFRRLQIWSQLPRRIFRAVLELPARSRATNQEQP